MTDFLRALRESLEAEMRVQSRLTIPLVLWRDGRLVSGPKAWVTYPPPAVITIAGPRLFRTLEEVVEHLTGEPTADRFVLQYIAKDPPAAVYLYAPEALAQMESA